MSKNFCNNTYPNFYNKMQILKKIIILIIPIILFTNICYSQNNRDSINILIKKFDNYSLDKLNNKIDSGSVYEKLTAYYLTGTKLFEKKRFKKASKNYFVITDLYNNYISDSFKYRVNVNRALSLYKLKKYNIALDLLFDSHQYISQTNDSIEQAKLLYDIANAYYNWGKYNIAGDYFQKAEMGFKNNKQYNLLTETYLKLGAVSHKLKLHETAISYYKKSERISKSKAINKNYINSLINIGIEYIALNKYDLAASYLGDALKNSEQINYTNGKIFSLNQIAKLFVAKNDNKSAMEFLIKSESILSDSSSIEIKVQILSNIATVYKLIKNYKKALSYYLRLYEILKKENSPYFIDNLQLNIAEIYKLTNNYELAIRYINICNNERQNNKSNCINADFQLSEIYMYQYKIEEAEVILKKTLENIKTVDNNELKSGIYLRLSDLNNIRNNHKKALYYYKKYEKIQNETLKNAYSFQLGKIQNDSKLQALSEELTISNFQNQLKLKEINYQKNVAIMLSIGSFLLLVLLIFLLKLYVDKVEAMKQLINKNIELAKQIPLKDERDILRGLCSDDDEKNKKLIELLIFKLENEKIYLERNLSLNSVSERLNTNRTYLSLAIKEILDTNFPNLVNKYRIEKARKMLCETKQILSIEGIALSVGFKSKSTFNSAFKKYTGVTPSFLRKQTKK